MVLDRKALSLLGLVVGTALMTAALVGFSNGFYPEYEYEVEQVTMDDEAFVYGWATLAPEVRSCGDGDRTLVCTFERTVREAGPVVRNESVRGLYRLVLFENGSNGGTYYRVTGTELANGSYAHDLERIETREALSIASMDARYLDSEFHRLLERGAVRSTTALHGWDAWEATDYHLVEHEGQFYRQGRFAYKGFRRQTERLVRAIVGVVGACLLAVSFRRAWRE